MNHNLGFPLGLPQISFFSSTQTQSISKVDKFRDLLNQNQTNQALELFSQDNEDLHYDFILTAAQLNKLNVVDHFINKGISPDIESNKGISLVYALSKKEEYFLALEHLINNHNAKINLKNTFYHPLLGTLSEKNINVKSFVFLVRHGADLDVITTEGDTCLLKLIKHKACKTIRWFLEQYKAKHGDRLMFEYINKPNFLLILPLFAALNLNNFDIAKHLVFLGATLPLNNKIISFNGLIKIIKLYDPPPTEKFVIFKKQQLRFEEFYYILTHRLCTDWCNINLTECRRMFDLPFPTDVIVKSAHICCANNLKHDYDSVKFICWKTKRNKAAKVVQNIYKKTQSERSEDYKIQKNAALKIQKTWRRKKNFHKLNERCAICMVLLNLFISDDALLPCKHIFHKHCIQKWRKENNCCPICKNSINKPLITL